MESRAGLDGMDSLEKRKISYHCQQLIN